MEAVFAALALYRRAFSQGAQLAQRNWPVLATVFAYTAIVYAAGFIPFQLGLLAGILRMLVFAACASSFLYLVEQIVRTSRVSLDDLRKSFGAYIWDVVTVNFVLWIGMTVLGLAVQGTPNAGLIHLCAWVAIAVFFNAVPELIYLSHRSAMEMFGESYRFIGENWIEWFPPNLLLAGGLFLLLEAAIPVPFGEVLRLAAAGLFVYFAMVVRGLLFLELSATSRRGRVFRHRTGG